ncbi:putative transmembrane protein [Rhodopirellula islandica]|uniref:Transmembrane protein n=1 Tax=Rhodopirellula islandica TaxID=595434 RepID=A0A0J1EFA7_RHOIS|nr:hypothetical protein [Rhodopirellula islandica]KLU04199.1 putative transmembrane protein [Rhodopirellula islandica]
MDVPPIADERDTLYQDPFDKPASSIPPTSGIDSTADARGVGITDETAAPIHASFWKKILIGAVVTPVVVGGMYRKFVVRNADLKLDLDPLMVGLILSLSAVAGGFLGALLAWKDRVEHRLANNLPVSFPSRFLFGYGIWSVILAWAPMAFLGTIVALMLSLSN